MIIHLIFTHALLCPNCYLTFQASTDNNDVMCNRKTKAAVCLLFAHPCVYIWQFPVVKAKVASTGVWLSDSRGQSRSTIENCDTFLPWMTLLCPEGRWVNSLFIFLTLSFLMRQAALTVSNKTQLENFAGFTMEQHYFTGYWLQWNFTKMCLSVLLPSSCSNLTRVRHSSTISALVCPLLVKHCHSTIDIPDPLVCREPFL